MAHLVIDMSLLERQTQQQSQSNGDNFKSKTKGTLKYSGIFYSGKFLYLVKRFI